MALSLFKGRRPASAVILGSGISLDRPGEKIALVLPQKDRKGHFWCFGTTRVGKTRIMENMVEQDIRNGFSVVVIDPKGDIELFSKIVQVAMEEGREEDLIFVSPIFPEYSAIIDPLSHYFMPEELVGHIVSGVEVGKEKFFYNVAYEISLVIVQALMLIARHQGRVPRFNLNDIKNRMSQTEIEKLKAEVDTIQTPEAEQLSRDMQKILDSPADYYGKVSSSLRVALMELTTGNIGKIIGRADENRFLKRLEAGKRVIMVVQLGSLLTRKAAFTVGKVILSMIQSFVGRVFSSGREVSPPLCIYVDEAQNVLYFGIDDLFAKAGGAGVWVHGFCQSVNQIYAALGSDYGNAILDNTNTKLFMRVPDSGTAEYVSRHFGIRKVYSPILSLGGGITSREGEEPAVRSENVLNLPPRKFYMLTYRGRFLGKSADVSPLYLKVRFPGVEVSVS